MITKTKSPIWLSAAVPFRSLAALLAVGVGASLINVDTTLAQAAGAIVGAIVGAFVALRG